MDVTVLNRQRKLKVESKRLGAVARAVLEALGRPEAELTVTLVSDRRMQELNKEFRSLDKPTDVLSFPQEEGEAMPHAEGMPEVLGDIVLSTETAQRQAGEHTAVGATAEESLHRELSYLLVHGALHLVGHTHDADATHAEMEAEMARVWSLLEAAGLV